MYITSWKTAQSIECFLCKHEDLSSISRTHLKKLGRVVYGIISALHLEAKMSRFLRLAGQPA